MNSEFGFENLKVYQRAVKFSVELCKLAVKFPYTHSRLRDQLVGAVISIPLNIAEGSGRFGKKEKINFYKYGRASVFECIPILVICYELKLIDGSELSKYKSEASELSKMLNGLIRSSR
jgi:four helix bundle protein